ncbi:blood group Rh(D) polypeptide-like isoform X2 [Mixophyes fleayi]|uniref:blood group Rh(D) polypeptide-like isoform X2 n=1 Tax=Mixophyes fleayi TaxID=3061075 RepID=UPI003F4DEBBC
MGASFIGNNIYTSFFVPFSARLQIPGKSSVVSSLRTGLMSVFPVLISSGVVLGKVNPVQLVMMTAMELPVFAANRYIMTTYLMMNDHISMMHASMFGAYFGLAVSWAAIPTLLGNKASQENEKSGVTAELFAMLGTLFMWTFWPSYNSVLLSDHKQLRNAIYNTYFALAASTVTVFSASALLNQKGKFKMIHARNAVLAGGVSVGFTAYMLLNPWIALTLGLLAGLISTFGFAYGQGTLNVITLVHDTCGVHYTFGLPGLLGGIAYSIIILVADYRSIEILKYQAVVVFGCVVLTLTLSLVGGLLTGFLLKCKLLRPPKEWHLFHDQPYWEFPHLASHI